MADRRAEKLSITQGGEYLMNILSRGIIPLMRKKSCCEQIKDSSNLQELRKMTLGLGAMNKGDVPYYGETNGSIELKIYKKSNIEIVYVAVKKGTVFSEHFHKNERETIAISKGKVSLETGALTVVFKAGEFVFLDKKLPHKLTILEDAILIITFLKMVNGVCNAGN